MASSILSLLCLVDRMDVRTDRGSWGRRARKVGAGADPNGDSTDGLGRGDDRPARGDAERGDPLWWALASPSNGRWRAGEDMRAVNGLG